MQFSIRSFGIDKVSSGTELRAKMGGGGVVVGRKCVLRLHPKMLAEVLIWFSFDADDISVRAGRGWGGSRKAGVLGEGMSFAMIQALNAIFSSK